MDYNQFDSNRITPDSPQPGKFTGFAIAALCCGIASLLCCCVGLGLPLGALAIIFVVINHRKGQSLDAMSITGIITGAIGLAMGLVIYMASLFVYEDPDFQQGMYDTFEETYGEDYADILAELYGWDLEELK